jgi:hypothetical protein
MPQRFPARLFAWGRLIGQNGTLVCLFGSGVLHR